jgi:hypothetical protein
LFSFIGAIVAEGTCCVWVGSSASVAEAVVRAVEALVRISPTVLRNDEKRDEEAGFDGVSADCGGWDLTGVV